MTSIRLLRPLGELNPARTSDSAGSQALLHCFLDGTLDAHRFHHNRSPSGLPPANSRLRPHPEAFSHDPWFLGRQSETQPQTPSTHTALLGSQASLHNAA